MKESICIVIASLVMCALCVYSGHRREQEAKEIEAYRNYYQQAEAILYYANTDSVPPCEYNRYLNAVAGVAVWQEDEP